MIELIEKFKSEYILSKRIIFELEECFDENDLIEKIDYFKNNQYLRLVKKMESFDFEKENQIIEGLETY